ncbi:MAG: cytochrome bc complex cytochrome b subunit [Caldilineae bacterium]|nr:cytochrome bc complex cytochrome b subunit [Chloroflexota bacterium]MCB9176892.1 cytochrome bc complex cytochrome b subunit [Caldilineae bacterium]
MLGIGSPRDLRKNASQELARLRAFDWKAYFAVVLDGVVRGLTAGFSVKELRAVLRGDPPTERPNPRYKSQVKSFTLHLRPKFYQRASTWFTHTWRLGWFSVYFFVVETITGLVLMVFYAPTPERAYGDMLYIMGNVPFGLFMRDLHRLGAEGMVAVVVLHMVRVYFTASYKGERAFTWFTGVVLLLVTLTLSFSGYLLPWDQLAYWAVTIGTSMADKAPVIGTEVNLLLRGALDIWAGGLLRFYLLHVLLLPLVAIIVISIHYYKVAREHSISLPASVEEGEMEPEAYKHATERIDLIPDLLIHEIMLTSVASFIMIASVATFFHAPMEAHADPQVTPLHTEAPWYFLWLQGLLKLGDPVWMGVILPGIIFGVLFVVPWLDRNPHRLPRKRPAAIIMGLATVITMVVLTYMGTPGYGIETPPAQDILSHLVPATHPGPVKELPWDEIEAGPFDEASGVHSKRTYFVSYPEAWASDPAYADTEQFVFVTDEGPVAGLDSDNEFLEVLHHFKAEVEHQPRLIAPVDNSLPLAQVTVEEVQPGVKWVEFRINWDEIDINPDGSPRFVEGSDTDIRLKRETKEVPAPDSQIEAVAVHRDSNYH